MPFTAKKFDYYPDRSYEGGGYDLGETMARPSRLLFAENLDLWLEVRKLKPVDLARKLKVSQTAVSRWRDGTSNPPFETMDRIARELDIPVAFFFRDLTDDRSEETPVTYEMALNLLKDLLPKNPKD